MTHACHQDNLVQQYRVQLLGFEVAMAVSTMAVLLALTAKPGWQLVLLLLLLWKHYDVSRGFAEAIRFRQRDVDWAQRELLKEERALPAASRTFTRFKIYQDRDPESLARKEAMFLSEEHVATPIDIDQYFFAHRSKSRGKAADLVALPSLMTRLIGLAGMAQILLKAFSS